MNKTSHEDGIRIMGEFLLHSYINEWTCLTVIKLRNCCLRFSNESESVKTQITMALIGCLHATIEGSMC